MSSLENLISGAKHKAAQKPKSYINYYDSNIKLLPFNNLSHFKNHLNYLFRTDANQLWTNGKTDENVYIFRDLENYEFTFANGLHKRDEYRRSIYETVKLNAKQDNRTIEKELEKIVMCRLDFFDSNVYLYDERIHFCTEQVLCDMEKNISGFHFICGVIHVDQIENYLHLHVLCYTDL